jgi:hypothetical protein
MSRLVLSLFLLFVLSGAQPVIKLGRTISGSGTLAVEGAPIANGIRYWYEYLQNNSNGGIVNNGVFYKVQMVEYDDASAPGNVDTLYRALVEFDNVRPRKLRRSCAVGHCHLWPLVHLDGGPSYRPYLAKPHALRL